MSDRNPLEMIALELGELRRELAGLHKAEGTRLTRAELCTRFGIHRNTLTRYMRDKGVPPPCRDGTWLRSEIIEWEARR